MGRETRVLKRGFGGQRRKPMSLCKSRIIISGGSHATCLGVPHTSLNLKPELVQIDYRFDAMTGIFPRDQAYWTELVNLAAHRTVAIIWNGNQHYGRFLLAETPPIDLVLPDEPHRPIDPNAVVVPVLRLKELWQQTFVELTLIIKSLKAREGCRPILVGTPPPIRTDESIRAALMRKDDFFVKVSQYFNIDLATADLTPRPVMYKLWATVQSSMRDVAELCQIPFLGVSRATQTDEGFLRDEYSQAVDFTHANSSYGNLMRAHIDAFAGGLEKEYASL